MYSYKLYTASNTKERHTKQIRHLRNVELYQSNTEHTPSAGCPCTTQDAVRASRPLGHVLKQQRKVKSEATQMRTGLPAVGGPASTPVPDLVQ